jgi:putative DNA primase/helicase
MALHHETGGHEDGLEQWVKWSSTAENFDEAECRRKWASFGRNTGEKVTVGTIYDLAKKTGWKNPGISSGEENLTDAGNGARLIRYFGEDLRYVPEKRKWIIYKDGLWRCDNDGGMERYAKQTTKRMVDEARQLNDDSRKNLMNHALRSENYYRLEAMIKIAKSEPEAVLGQIHLDSDPDVLGIEDGILNLRTGEMRPGRREDYITKKSRAALTNATEVCPVWLGFLDKVMAGNQDLIGYIRRAVGYSLTGHTWEQCLFFLYGTGANGKSTFLKVLQRLLGDYCLNVEPDTIMIKYNSGGATPELARLAGARAVITIEMEEGKRLAENRIKQMTGNDTMIARHLYQEPFEFKPEFKIWMAGNHKPAIKGTDHAIWRRIHLIPFTVTIPKEEQDSKLSEKLKAELPGILRWAAEGTREWREAGLNPPQQVLAAVNEYREEMDTVGHWIEECCIQGNEHQTQSSILYRSYKFWCLENGHHPMSQTRFGTSLSERGLKKIKAGVVYWHSLKLRQVGGLEG